MTPEKQRIAIAKVCGWEELSYSTNNCIRPDGKRIFFRISDGFDSVVPDYPSDLNAMHEVEKMILYDASKWAIYRRQLGEDLHATAPQRAEAFLRTIGLWEDSSDAAALK